MSATLIIDTVLLLAIVGVSVYGAVTLPNDAELPLHLGPAGYTNWQRKNFALVLWPALAVAVYLILVVSGHGQQGTSGRGLPLPIGLTVVLAIMLASHVGALNVAIRRGGRR
jgi:hypothetical protein